MSAEQSLGADLTAEVDLSAGPPPRTDLHDPAARGEVERSLTTIPGVLAARLVAGFERQVDELHVLTSLDRGPKQTVRDAQTLLMARFGVPTDHRVISVVQLDEDRGLPTAGRVSIDQVSVTGGGLTVTAEVALRDVDAVHRGAAQGSGTASGRHRAIAAACLSAVRALLADDTVVELEAVDTVTVAAVELAVAVVQVRTPRSEAVLTGSALVREATADAIVRAVLDALNRTIADAPR